MNIRRFMGVGFLWAALAVQPAFAAPAWSPGPVDQCPLLPDTAPIEVLPFFHSGDTCKAPVGIECEKRADKCKYSSPTCTIPEVNYFGPDAIYKVSLHEGNRVGFHLTNLEPPAGQKPADLVLVLIDDCGEGKTCVSNSTDFIGPHDEEIPEAHYDPGDYYLYVDSADNGHCGNYQLTVTGVNPTPDLEMTMVSPGEVVAGENLTYTLTVRNKGQLSATNVEIVQTLPDEVTFGTSSSTDQAPPKCTMGQGREVLCVIGDLPIGGMKTFGIQILVAPRHRGPLLSSAVASAKEGDSNVGDNRSKDVKTEVIAESALSIETHAASRTSVIAGEPKLLTYTFRVKNYGSSDATKVKVTDDLPDEVSFVRFVKAPRSCRHPGGNVECTISRIAKDASIDVSFQVKIKSSARNSLSNTVLVDADEPEPRDHPKPRPISSSLIVDVTRKTDLFFTKATAQQDPVAAGEDLDYEFTVFNDGPSDSTGATLHFDLPSGLTFQSPQGSCSGHGEQKITVVCGIGPIARSAQKGENVAFTAHVGSSMRAGVISSQATVTGKEPEPAGGGKANTSDPVKTRVKVNADLRLTMTDQPVSGEPPVSAGENLLYTMIVDNEGPSDSQGGNVSVTLPPGGLTFVASPDGCSNGAGEVTCTVPPLVVKGPWVTCTVPPLVANESWTAQFVASVSSGFTGDSIENVAKLTGIDDPDSECLGPVITDVTQEADLAVAVKARTAEGSGELVYTLTVTNIGPSDAADPKLTLTLTGGGKFDTIPEEECDKVSLNVVVCDRHEPLLAGGIPWTITVSTDPSNSPSTTGTAELISATEDPLSANNRVTLPSPGDADLAVTKRAGFKTVAPGDSIKYTIEVTNNGPGAAAVVKVEDDLPAGVIFTGFEPKGACKCPEGEDPERECQEGEAPELVICNFLDPLVVGDELKQDEKRAVVLTVQVNSDFAADRLSNTADIPTSVSDAVHDPNLDNNHSTVTVLHVPPLVVPFFEVANGVTTRHAVKNFSEAPLTVDYEYILSGSTDPVTTQHLELSRKATHIVDIGTVPELPSGGSAGYVGIKPSGTEPSVLSGDFTRIKNGLANGLPLISTDTSRVPPELCRRWSTRFLNERSLVTEFLFFVPGNQGGKVTGKVYNEAGAFVQEISLTESREAFRSTTLEEFDDNVKLLANFGSIEWELPEGVVGNVAAVHRAAGQHAVAVPGFCRDGNLGAASDLIVPYFEVDSSKEISTLLAVRNETADTMDISFNYFSADGALLSASTLALAGHATQTVNLKEVENVQGSGYVEIESTGTVSGDFMWIEPGRGAAGGALVDIGPDRVPPQLCKQWDVRFSQGVPEGAATAATDFIFYIPRDNKADEPDATGQVYDEKGEHIVTDLPVPNPHSAFRISAEDLDLTGSGSIEWTLRDPLKGYVATVVRAPGVSPVLLPGVCRKP